jgi:hypothetical protein
VSSSKTSSLSNPPSGGIDTDSHVLKTGDSVFLTVSVRPTFSPLK